MTQESTPMATVTPEMAALAAQLEASPAFRVLRQFDQQALFNPGVLDGVAAADIGVAVALDTETTGRDQAVDKIIELGMVSFAYHKRTGVFLTALARFNQLEDPQMTIPEAATQVNGITDEMVRGMRIDDAAVQQMVEQADFVIAHNAAFDRGFCERRFPVFKGMRWACSLSQVDWAGAGIGSAKLEFIAYRLGFFYDAHRAEMDCLALLNALRQPLPTTPEATALQQVIENFKQDGRRIWAVGAPFDAKDLLKVRGYRWSDGTKPGAEKAWVTEVPLELLEEEIKWLRSAVFNNRSFSVPVDRIDSFSRFSERRDKLERAYA